MPLDISHSLAPYGASTGYRIRRLTDEFPNSPNGEDMILRLWETRNAVGPDRDPPIRDIIHRLMPGFGTRYRLMQGDLFCEGRPYLERDIRVLANTVQLLGANFGWYFLKDHKQIRMSPRYHPARAFVLMLEHEEGMQAYGGGTPVTRHVTHLECTPSCSRPDIIGILSHRFQLSDTTERDKMLVRAFMYWLGLHDGQEFIRDYHARFGEEADRKRAALWSKRFATIR